MKQILLVGSFNRITNNLYETLSEKFRVQLSSAEPEMLVGLVKMTRPDLILISMLDLTSENEEVFSYIKKHCATIPVICIGNEKEMVAFEEYFKEKQFEKLFRPVKLQDILKRIYDRLHLSGESTSVYSILKKQRKCVLLIDDSVMQLRMMKGLLQDSYDVEMAKSGDEALRIMKTHTPDMIFLDYDMPGCDGRMVLEQIREDEWFRDIPVVFLTGVNDRKRIHAVMSLKPAGYMLKPVTQKKIMETVHEIIGM